ncbi:GGDEF domain-containing protein [Mycobacterium sp. 21AC1]|uniref:GGDEF domain-containing protein n=1 Tax=[Mycobacterium] appelbergii TaxID=2939269 RepID=UPI002938E972|nr:GGDEF domain-containing protein [Mycobacterium sp. 21AC1]MDV3123340.1 GGDEF domain-containing protein [Mycobacterium sp. 21AC1]
MPSFGEVLRRRMLIVYLAILLALYLLAIVSSVGRGGAHGELAAVVLCGLGLILTLRSPLRSWRYVLSVLCACAAPVAPLLAHHAPVAQVWSLIPLMFAAVYVRSWHRTVVARTAALLIAAAAVTGLLIAPAKVPTLWLIVFPVCIVGAAEVLGLLHSTLLEAALRDPLTAVWNRAGLDREVGKLLSRTRRRGDPVTAIVLDIDDFKTINDRGGHAEGDRVLVRLTREWTAQLPGSAVIGRLGGDEFVAVVAGYEKDQVTTMAAALRGDGPVHVSTGLAVGHPYDAKSFAALLGSADHDLYLRKAERKRKPAEER